MAKEETALLGGGCFWCIEAVYSRTKGVLHATSGYAGGARPNPNYEMVCTGVSGYAEVVEVRFDPEVISYEEILEIFWQIHDPTTLNRQGADQGTQYRSVIYYYNEEQREKAIESARIHQETVRDPIVTELSPAPVFYPAEGYHQDYFTRNPQQGYCRMVVAPKVEKFMMKFPQRLER